MLQRTNFVILQTIAKTTRKKPQAEHFSSNMQIGYILENVTSTGTHQLFPKKMRKKPPPPRAHEDCQLVFMPSPLPRLSEKSPAKKAATWQLAQPVF